MDPLSEQKLQYHRKRVEYHERKALQVLEQYSRAAQQVKAKPMPKKPAPALEDKGEMSAPVDVEPGAWFQLAPL